jgi:hypothetical protein
MSRSKNTDRKHDKSDPYWAFGWWKNHKPRTGAALLRIWNRKRRAAQKQALREEREPERNRKSISWVFW